MNLKRVVKLKHEFRSKNSFFSFTTRLKFFTSVSPLTYKGRVSFVSSLKKSNGSKELSIYEIYVNFLVPLSSDTTYSDGEG